MNSSELLLDGFWDFGYSATEPEPATEAVAPVPVCADALLERLGHGGYASFRKRVHIGGKVRLRVTAGLRHRVCWDGREVGSSVLAYTREEYDFDAGQEGEHELAIFTENFLEDVPSSAFRPFYDFYGYNGIYDRVTIERLLPGMVDCVSVVPLAEPPGSVMLKLHAVSPHPETLEIAFDGAVPRRFLWSEKLTLAVPDWQFWSPENPHLHQVTVNGRTEEFGIRTLSWQGRRLLLNGSPVKLLGVNRHEAHPEFGPATPESLIWNDLLALKRHGFNFIRGSHYPQREFTLACADRLGLLVWEEALGWGNKEADLTDPLFGARQEEQCRKMVRKSFNHPSVIIWGFLNECESNKESALPLVIRLRDTIHSLDPVRPVTFATCRPQEDKCITSMDIISINTYPDWYDTNTAVSDMGAIGWRFDELVRLFQEDKPLIISEIGCGAMYGDHSGFRWSEEYQVDYMTTVIREIRDREAYSGVSLWQYCDTRTCQTTHHTIGTPRGFNNKGLVNEYRLPKLAWKALKPVLNESNGTEKRGEEKHCCP